MGARQLPVTPGILPPSQQLQQKLSVSLRNSFNNVPEFSSVGSGHVTRSSQSRSLGLRRWDILIAQAWITCPPLEPMCVRSSLLEPQEPRVGSCGFTRGIRAVGHKKSVGQGELCAATSNPDCQWLAQSHFISCSHWWQGWGSTSVTQASGGCCHLQHEGHLAGRQEDKAEVMFRTVQAWQ